MSRLFFILYVITRDSIPTTSSDTFLCLKSRRPPRHRSEAPRNKLRGISIVKENICFIFAR